MTTSGCRRVQLGPWLMLIFRQTRMSRLSVLGVVATACISSAAAAQSPSAAAGLWATEGYGIVFDVGRRHRRELRGHEGLVHPDDTRAPTIAPPTGAIAAFTLPNAPVTFVILPGTTAERRARPPRVRGVGHDHPPHRPQASRLRQADAQHAALELRRLRRRPGRSSTGSSGRRRWTGPRSSRRTESRVTDATTPEQLFDILSGMISPLQDAHSYIGARAIKQELRRRTAVAELPHAAPSATQGYATRRPRT